MTSEVEIRSAQLATVDFPKRLIELVVMPYETWADNIVYHGRVISEIVSRGAFNGIEQRTSRIKVNLDHDIRQVVGRAIALHPSRTEGLVAEVKITRADEGEPILIKADEGLLDASAGFALLWDKQTGKPKPGAETWETQTRRRLNHLHLDHIALTPNPAYTDSRVLAVRKSEPVPVSAMPNRDWVRLEAWRELQTELDKRYGLSR
jgi:HK97 family phage prohead protease